MTVRVDVHVRMPGGFVAVPALAVAGVWAVHRTFGVEVRTPLRLILSGPAMEGVYSLTHAPSGYRVAWCSRVEPLAALAAHLPRDHDATHDASSIHATVREYRDRYAEWGLT